MKVHRILSGMVVAGALSIGAHAQTAKPTLDYSSAATIRDTCLKWASEHDLKVAIAVMDTHGMLVTFAHMDGVKPVIGEVAQWKARASSQYGRSTEALAALNPPANMPGVATIRGGVPIYTRDGLLLGGVGTSGAKSEEDATCGTAGVEAAGLTTAAP
ncbi:GlcG/HbpS family heme-binding protein [Parasphingorhabdus sp.]|uniref:GlcG/HbpS family heme-binding protein n=1 Tax=Parasphingorhabdus sp. TaxID=2709688 RepID=UPI003A93B9BC